MQMSRFKFNIQEHDYTTEFPLYSFPHTITFSPGTAVAVAARFLTCQSIRRGRFFRVTFPPRELSTNNVSVVVIDVYELANTRYLTKDKGYKNRLVLA